MTSRNTKIFVNASMMIFLILSFIRWDGDPSFHFIVGSICFLLFIIHICIHRKWLKAVTKAFLSKKINNTIKGKYIINVFLLLTWAIVIITGFLAIGPYMSGIERSVFGRFHGLFARLGLLLIIFHVVQHRSQIVFYFKKDK